MNSDEWHFIDSLNTAAAYWASLAAGSSVPRPSGIVDDLTCLPWTVTVAPVANSAGSFA